MAAWSQVAAFKGWSPVKPGLGTGNRRTRLGNILKVHGLDGWIAALQRAADSEVLGGPDPPSWFNFAFMIHPDKFLNVQDGNYDKSFNSNRSGDRQSPWITAHAKLSVQ